jgi:hypothetical protein
VELVVVLDHRDIRRPAHVVGRSGAAVSLNLLVGGVGPEVAVSPIRHQSPTGGDVELLTHPRGEAPGSGELAG